MDGQAAYRETANMKWRQDEIRLQLHNGLSRVKECEISRVRDEVVRGAALRTRDRRCDTVF